MLYKIGDNVTINSYPEVKDVTVLESKECDPVSKVMQEVSVRSLTNSSVNGAWLVTKPEYNGEEMHTKLEINQKVYHPCSLDIIEHKVISVTEYEDRVVYKTRSMNPVGACGKVEVLLSIDRKGVLRFTGLADDYEYDSGLQDFVEGIYYTSIFDARTVFYGIQKTLVEANVNEKKRLLAEAERSYSRVCKILDEIKKERGV